MKENKIMDKKVVLLVRSSKPKAEAEGSSGAAIADSLKERGIAHFWVWADRVHFVESNRKSITIDNGEEEFTINPKMTVALVRGGTMDSVKGGEYTINLLHECGVHVINTLKAIKNVSNKKYFADILERFDVETPRTIFIRNEAMLEKMMDKLPEFPVIVKTVNGSKGVGVVKVDKRSSLKSVLQAMWKFGSEVIIQEMVNSEYDVRTIIIGGEIVGAMKRARKKESSEFRNNYAQGGDIGDYKLSKTEKKIVLAAAKASGCEICGVDHIVDSEGKPFVIEVNSSPGTAGFKKFHPDIIDNMIDYALKQAGKNNDPQIAGKTEKAEIVGIGIFDAKLDTGSDATTTLDARDIEEDEEKGEITAIVKGVKKTFKLEGHITSNKANRRDESKRPYIIADLRLGGTTLKNTKIVLADRSKFDFAVLVSAKDLSRAGILVDPGRYYALKENTEAELPGLLSEANNMGVQNYLNRLLNGAKKNTQLGSPQTKGYVQCLSDAATVLLSIIDKTSEIPEELISNTDAKKELEVMGYIDDGMNITAEGKKYLTMPDIQTKLRKIDI
jgi:ribosomal protein S6--L-glutamate ligase